MSKKTRQDTTDAEQGMLFDVAEFRADRPETEAPGWGRPRMKLPERGQVKFMAAAWDDLLPEVHEARIVWDFVAGLDLSSLHSQIRAVEGRAGAPAATSAPGPGCR